MSMTYAARITALLKTCTPLEDMPQPFDEDRRYSEREIDRLNSDKELRSLVPELLKGVAELTALRARVGELERALQEADTIMGHDDSETEWRERWGALWPSAAISKSKETGAAA